MNPILLIATCSSHHLQTPVIWAEKSCLLGQGAIFCKQWEGEYKDVSEYKYSIWNIPHKSATDSCAWCLVIFWTADFLFLSHGSLTNVYSVKVLCPVMQVKISALKKTALSLLKMIHPSNWIDVTSKVLVGSKKEDMFAQTFVCVFRADALSFIAVPPEIVGQKDFEAFWSNYCRVSRGESFLFCCFAGFTAAIRSIVKPLPDLQRDVGAKLPVAAVLWKPLFFIFVLILIFQSGIESNVYGIPHIWHIAWTFKGCALCNLSDEHNSKVQISPYVLKAVKTS